MPLSAKNQRVILRALRGAVNILERKVRAGKAERVVLKSLRSEKVRTADIEKYLLENASDADKKLVKRLGNEIRKLGMGESLDLGARYDEDEVAEFSRRMLAAMFMSPMPTNQEMSGFLKNSFEFMRGVEEGAKGMAYGTYRLFTTNPRTTWNNLRQVSINEAFNNTCKFAKENPARFVGNVAISAAVGCGVAKAGSYVASAAASAANISVGISLESVIGAQYASYFAMSAEYLTGLIAEYETITATVAAIGVDGAAGIAGGLAGATPHTVELAKHYQKFFVKPAPENRRENRI